MAQYFTHWWDPFYRWWWQRLLKSCIPTYHHWPRYFHLWSVWDQRSWRSLCWTFCWPWKWELEIRVNTADCCWVGHTTLQTNPVRYQGCNSTARYPLSGTPGSRTGWSCHAPLQPPPRCRRHQHREITSQLLVWKQVQRVPVNWLLNSIHWKLDNQFWQVGISCYFGGVTFEFGLSTWRSMSWYATSICRGLRLACVKMKC